MIAADANNNGTITTADQLLVRDLILGNKTNLYPQGLRSWRFTNLFEFSQGGANAMNSFCSINANFATAPFSQNLDSSNKCNGGRKIVKINFYQQGEKKISIVICYLLNLTYLYEKNIVLFPIFVLYNPSKNNLRR